MSDLDEMIAQTRAAVEQKEAETREAQADAVMKQRAFEMAQVERAIEVGLPDSALAALEKAGAYFGWVRSLTHTRGEVAAYIINTACPDLQVYVAVEPRSKTDARFPDEFIYELRSTAGLSNYTGRFTAPSLLDKLMLLIGAAREWAEKRINDDAQQQQEKREAAYEREVRHRNILADEILAQRHLSFESLKLEREAWMWPTNEEGDPFGLTLYYWTWTTGHGAESADYAHGWSTYRALPTHRWVEFLPDHHHSIHQARKVCLDPQVHLPVIEERRFTSMEQLPYELRCERHPKVANILHYHDEQFGWNLRYVSTESLEEGQSVPTFDARIYEQPSEYHSGYRTLKIVEPTPEIMALLNERV